MGNSPTQKIIPKCHDPVTILTDGDNLCNKYFGNTWMFNNIEKSDCPDKYLRASCKKGEYNNVNNSDDYLHKQIIFDKDPQQNVQEENCKHGPINNANYMKPSNGRGLEEKKAFPFYDSLAPCNFSNCGDNFYEPKIHRDYKKKEYIDNDIDKKIFIPKARYQMDRVLKPESTEKFTDTKLYVVPPNSVVEIDNNENSLFHNIIHVVIFFIFVYLLYCLFSGGSGLI